MPRFKIDENLPVEVKDLLTAAGHDALTVPDERLRGAKDAKLADVCVQEHRTLITLDLDFADIRAYPPEKSDGIIVLRLHSQHRALVLSVVQRLMPLLTLEPVQGHLWIVDENSTRIRGGRT